MFTSTTARHMVAIAVVTGFVLAACTATRLVPDAADDGAGGTPPGMTAGWQEARIVGAPSPVECVPYARRLSGIAIRGDAWTWWRAAAGRYPRSARPAVGSVLVLKRSHWLRGGHVAVVTGILSDREIVVEHANWLNRGRIHKSNPVVDVSRDNDWSAVRLWYTPGQRYGTRTYPAHGFILPDAPTATDAPRRPPGPLS